MTDYQSLIGRTLTTYAGSRLRTLDGQDLMYGKPQSVVLVDYLPQMELFICDLRTADEHDGTQVYMSAYAVEQKLGLSR